MADYPVGSDGMTAIEQLAEFAAGVRLASTPDTAAERLRLHLLDTIGAALVGARTAEGRAITDLVRDTGTRGDVRAVGLGIQTSAGLAALATCAAIRCTEVDDIHLESCTTPGSVVVSTALALAQGRPEIDSDDFVSALLAGYELMTRLGKGVDGPAIIYRGLWPTYLTGVFGAAATASRLLALTAEETAHALATALTLSSGATGRGGPIASRWLTLGCAVQNGLLAALSARHGFRGALSLLEGSWGQMTGVSVNVGRLLEGLGASFEIEKASLKPYCAAKQATGAIHAFIRLLEEEGIAPSAIDGIVVAVPGQYARMIDQPAIPAGRATALLSVQYLLALAAYHPEGLTGVLRPVIHQEPEVRGLMQRVAVESDEGLSRYYPEAWPARVEVQVGSRRFRREIHHTPGDPDDPMGWDAATTKFRQVVGGILNEPAIDRLASVCRGLGEDASLADLLADLPKESEIAEDG